MAYLTLSDFRTRQREAYLQQMIDSDSNVLEGAIAEAQSIISDYLLPTYDVASIFQATGADRNAHLVMHMIHFSLYILYQRLPEFELPETILTNYQDSKGYLEKVMLGKFDMNLPRAVDEEGENITVFRAGSDDKRTISDRVL